MNQTLYNLFESSGLRETSKNVFEGNLNGYPVTLGYFPMQVNSYRLLFPVYIPEQARQAITNELKPYANQYFMFGFDQFGLFVILESFVSATFPKQWNKMIPIITASLEKHEISKLQVCPSCGCELNEDNSRTTKIQFATPRLCLDCISKINETIEERNKEIDAAPGSYLKGFLGGLLGALCGAGLFFVISLFGFISALGALLGAVLGFLFSDKFGGKKNLQMAIIVALTNIIVLALTVFFWMYTTAAFNIAADAGSMMPSHQAFALYMQEMTHLSSILGSY